MDSEKSLPQLQCEDMKKIQKSKEKKAKELKENPEYSEEILRKRCNTYINTYLETDEIKKSGLPIRQQNPPEDITENIVKFIVRNYDNDPLIMWAKCAGEKGDLITPKYVFPPEVKSFTSDGPCSFGPNKKFGVLYFLDLREWIKNNKIILWRIDVSSESPEFKQLKMNKGQTHEEQCGEKRRPHIAWNLIYTQLADKCVKVYEGTFENIFIANQQSFPQLV